MLARDTQAISHAIKKCCEIKARIVNQDEKEAGRRAILNFGHTFGHAIESALGYGKWLHGEAVGCGMVMAAKLSNKLGMLAADECSAIESVVKNAGLPIALPNIDPIELLRYMRLDKKSVAKRVQFVLLQGMGNPVIREVGDQEILDLMAS